MKALCTRSSRSPTAPASCENRAAYVALGDSRQFAIGKQYRVTHEEIEAIVGANNTRETVARRRRAEVSSVVQMDAITDNMR